LFYPAASALNGTGSTDTYCGGDVGAQLLGTVEEIANVKDRPAAMRQIVTLHLSDGSQIGSMGVRRNRHGQLPALIVDPQDASGRTLPGMWLGDVQDRSGDGTSYRQLTHSG
jgi:hypothetical protein